MLQIEINSIQQGMTLALPLRHPKRRDQILLREGYEIVNRDLKRLEQLGVGALWVHFEGLEFLRKYINPGVFEAQEPVIETVAKVLFDSQRIDSFKFNSRDCSSVINSLVNELIENPHAALFLGHVGDPAMNDLVRHSCTVTYLSVLMGLKLEGYLIQQRKHIMPSRAKELVNLGLGAMLHDVGITKLPSDVLNSFSQSGDESDLSWQEHTALGYELLQGKMAPSAANSILNHHQLLDGTGFAGSKYPVLNGHKIHIFARILAVADRFERLCRPVNECPRPAVWALSQLSHPSMSEKYDSNVLRALFTVVPPYPPGSVVKLCDGRYAVCIRHVPNDPCRPVVQIIGDEQGFDFNTEMKLGELIELEEVGPRLYIAEFNGIDVSEMNFRQPEVMYDPHNYIACV